MDGAADVAETSSTPFQSEPDAAPVWLIVRQRRHSSIKLCQPKSPLQPPQRGPYPTERVPCLPRHSPMTSRPQPLTEPQLFNRILEVANGNWRTIPDTTRYHGHAAPGNYLEDLLCRFSTSLGRRFSRTSGHPRSAVI